MLRIPRILLVVAITAVVAMHGADAATAAQHVAAPAVAHHDSQDPDPVAPPDAGPDVGDHVVMLCIAVLVGAAGFAGRRLVFRLASAVTTWARLAHSNSSEIFEEILRPPPPAWVRLCVHRR